jgi:hypothetical protein
VRLFELTAEGLDCARQARKDNTLLPGKLPIRVVRADLKAALVYYWGRGIPLDPSHLKWDLKKAAAH